MNPTIIFLVLAACGDTVEPVTLPAPQAIRAADDAGLFAWSPEDTVLSSVRLGGDMVRLELFNDCLGQLRSNIPFLRGGAAPSRSG